MALKIFIPKNSWSSAFVKIYLLLRLYSWIPEEISIEYSYKKQFVFSNNSSSFFFLPYSTLKQTKTRFSLSFLLSFLRSRNDRTKFWNYEKSTIRNPSSLTTSKMLISPQSLSHVPRYRSPISKRYQRRGPRVQSSYPSILQVVKTTHTSWPRPRKKFLTSTLSRSCVPEDPAARLE